MLVGLIGDTHDNLPMVEKAIRRLNQEKTRLVLHTGDYVSPFVIPRFKALEARLIGVFGNNDGDRELLKQRFKENERLEIQGTLAKASVDGLKIGMVHGSEEELLKVLIESEIFDVVVHGHTHTAEVCRKGKTLVVNPGEVCGYLSGKATIGLLDADAREARIVEL